MSRVMPEWLNPEPWLETARHADVSMVDRAIASDMPGEKEMAALLSPAAQNRLEAMAQRASALTRRHFGRTVSLYVPLYLSSYCSGGCAYCGFASDRPAQRHKLSEPDALAEMDALRSMDFEEVLLLTGERTREAGYEFVHKYVGLAAERFSSVTVEVFPMTRNEYHGLAQAGCTGLTLYQETYHPERYDKYHRWGPKKDYLNRVDGPERALAGGLRSAGLGALLGLAEPAFDMISLYRHARHLQKTFWKASLSLSFPRIQPQRGDFHPDYVVDDRQLAQIIFAFRICLPEVHLVLSTRERSAFRDGMAGMGISKMSIASKTTVGGYSDTTDYSESQFEISDTRDVKAFCRMLHSRGLEPVFKNWDPVYRDEATYKE